MANRRGNAIRPERARARGVRLGCNPKLTRQQKREAIRRREELGKPK